MRSRRRLGSRSPTYVVLIALLGILAMSSPSRAHAFGNPKKFAASVELGGGGQRFFTGSQRDAYTCAACHGAVTASDVAWQGVPSDGYLPGQTYQFLARWSESASAVALNLEVTNGDGVALGILAVPVASQLDAAEQCPETGDSPATLVAVDNRTIVTVAACGTRQVSLLWTAPAAPVDGRYYPSALPVAYFAAAAVEADGDEDFTGDRVSVTALPLRPWAADVPVAQTTTTVPQCQVSTLRTTRPPMLACTFVAFLLVRARRRAFMHPVDDEYDRCGAGDA